MTKGVIVALCEEGVDRNLGQLGVYAPRPASPSAKRAWIEIRASPTSRSSSYVALCEEGVDRNVTQSGLRPSGCVALCEEGVDRNARLWSKPRLVLSSPSAKRAWIEI